MISDLVSSGQTLRDNRLRPLGDGIILRSQAALIANKAVLKNNPAALQMARQLLEYFEAHLRARDNLSVVANIRGTSGEAIANRLFTETSAGGLQGPTISRVYVTRRRSKLVCHSPDRPAAESVPGDFGFALHRRQRGGGLAGIVYLRRRTSALYGHAESR